MTTQVLTQASNKRRAGGWRHAVEVLVRTLAAAFGGYLLAHAFSALAASVLPFARPDRVVAGALLAFPVWCAAAVYAFGARDWKRAAGIPLLLALAMLGLAALLAEQALRP
ncbi:DUF3649 domain-containing protein [Luteimonas sp. RD2P54]|uniref:DUF3649 domain-containing protein n=1 Tax=Luteimonas endophytica TaxID=3042023 RepID=A0ABT6JBH3_9GAMM|nr:DUF3649 domain-containing protein [Luteimonas endophytica]MDH5824172.1 DUF3649 domain-containing protein [Luteimonas endophytica]